MTQLFELMNGYILQQMSPPQHIWYRNVVIWQFKLIQKTSVAQAFWDSWLLLTSTTDCNKETYFIRGIELLSLFQETKLAECMYSFKAYRTDEDFAEVDSPYQQAFVSLRARILYRVWRVKKILKFKMDNYRSKLFKPGCLDVSVNGGRRHK